MLMGSQQGLAYLYSLEAEPAVRCPRKVSATLSITDWGRTEVVVVVVVEGIVALGKSGLDAVKHHSHFPISSMNFKLGIIPTHRMV